MPSGSILSPIVLPTGAVEVLCIIISNLLKTSNYQYNYLVGVIAERWIWMGDEELIFNAINGDSSARALLREKGVQYLLLDKEKTSKIEDEQIVYSNDQVCIVDLFKTSLP